VSFSGFSLESTADDPTDAIHQLLLWEDPSQLPKNLLLFRLKYVEEYERIRLTDQCRNNILDSVKQANHSDYEKSKPRAVRRQLLQMSNETVIANSRVPLTKVTRGTVCATTQCDLCALVVAVARLIQNVEISDVAAAFGGRWSHSKIHEGYLPFGSETCCREAHGLLPPIRPDYRFKKQKTAFVPATTSQARSQSPSYQPLSPVMIDGESVIVESGSSVDLSREIVNSEVTETPPSVERRKKVKGKRTIVRTEVVPEVEKEVVDDSAPLLVLGVESDTSWTQFISDEEFC
jgi:hypothetical protein